MTADVYAADCGLSDAGASKRASEYFVIRLVADADPDVLHRVSAQLNLLNEAPMRVLFERSADDTAAMTILIRCSARAADLVRRKLEQLTSVVNVSATPNDGEHDPDVFRAGTEDRQ
jgi:hypothetical protein